MNAFLGTDLFKVTFIIAILALTDDDYVVLFMAGNLSFDFFII